MNSTAMDERKPLVLEDVKHINALAPEFPDMDIT
jgi:hypothetical protein